MGFGLRVRSCRYMPPEDYEEFGEHSSPHISAVGARTYSDIARKYSRISGNAHRRYAAGPFSSLKSFLGRLGLFHQ